MAFYDTSALLPWLRHERRTETTAKLIENFQPIIVWWGTETECESALSRLEREAQLHRGHLQRARGRLQKLKQVWHVVQATNSMKNHASRLLRTHILKAADALQLSAAITLADGHTADIHFVSFDQNLLKAAEKEGFLIPEICWEVQSNT